jgi:hypothetical protein
MSVVGVNSSAINSISSISVVALPIITDEVFGGNGMLFSDFSKGYGGSISLPLVLKKRT